MFEGGPPGRSRASPSIPQGVGDRRSGRAHLVGPWLVVLCLVGPKPNDVFYATRLPFDPGSPTTGCACAQWSPSYVGELWSPNLIRALGKPRAKANANCQRVFPARNAEGLSLSGGA